MGLTPNAWLALVHGLMPSFILCTTPSCSCATLFQAIHCGVMLTTTALFDSFRQCLMKRPYPAVWMVPRCLLRRGTSPAGGPRTRAAQDFVITMTTPTHNAKHGFRLHRDLLPLKLHQLLCNLLAPLVNTTSHILQQHQIPTSPPQNCIHRLCAIYPNYGENHTFSLIHLRKECSQSHQTTLQQLSFLSAANV
jgi:hypothetical protein